MSADPLPIPMPVIMAGVAGTLAGVFACADTALTSVSRAHLEALADEETRFRRPMERAVRRRNRLQGRYVAGRVITLAFAAGAYALWLAQLPSNVELRVAATVGGILLLALVVEAASAVGRHASDTLLPWLVTLLLPLELVMAPVAFLTSGFTGLVRWRQTANPKIAEREMENLVDQGERSGTLEQEPAELIRNVLEFSELTTHDAMVPRKRMVAIKIDTDLDDVLSLITASGHSRYPVYRQDVDDISGVLCAKDLFRVFAPLDSTPPMVNGGGRRAKLLDIVREPVKFVSESQPLSSLLREMRQERQHLAIVVDEFGGTAGLVTLEDILEEIVGDIQDEYDIDEVPIVDLGQGRLIADAAVLVSDLSAYLGSDLDPEGQYDSLGGMLTDKLGSVPVVGTSIPTHGLKFIVRESDEKHIAKVEIVRPVLAADASGSHPV